MKKDKPNTSATVQDILNNDYRFSRWAALYDGINLIFEHSLERNKQFGDLDLKPLAIQKYVDNKADEILQDIHREKDNHKKRQQT